jgi:hypothetical protein
VIPAKNAGLRGDPAENIQNERSRKTIGIQSSWTNGERPRLRGANGAARFPIKGARGGAGKARRMGVPRRLRSRLLSIQVFIKDFYFNYAYTSNQKTDRRDGLENHNHTEDNFNHQTDNVGLHPG